MMTDSDLLTVSLGTWMELPDLTMKDWRPDVLVDNRVSVSTVAAYYKEYVQHMSLSSNFLENTFVTSVRRVANCCVPRPSNIESKHIKDSSEDEFNALFQQEYLYNEKVNGKECDDCEDVEFSSCTGGATASCSSCCSEVTSASYDEAVTTAEETVDDFCTSGTRIGQLMRVQARRRANTTCCLDLVSKNNATNCLEMKNYDLSWNPIVFEKMASNSAGAGLACSFGAYGRSYSWGASKRNTISRCIHNLYYLYISKLSFFIEFPIYRPHEGSFITIDFMSCGPEILFELK